MFRKENGQAAVMLAIGVVVLLIFAALAIDAGNMYTVKREAQNAADAAAMAGTRQLVLECSGAAAPTEANILNGVSQMSLANAKIGATSAVKSWYVKEDGSQLNPNPLPLGAVPCGCEATKARGVQVEITVPAKSFFGSLVGQGATVKASAKARYAPLGAASSGVFPITRRYDPTNWPEPGEVMQIRLTDNLPATQGNFGWLTWYNDPSATALSNGLTWPGTFANPPTAPQHTQGYCDVTGLGSPTVMDCNRPGGRTLSIGEWVQGSPGNVNSMKDELIQLMKDERVLILPLYDGTPQGQGSNFYYQVAAFAAYQLVPGPDGNPYKFTGKEEYVIGKFLGMATVGDPADGCIEGGVNTVRLVP